MNKFAGFNKFPEFFCSLSSCLASVWCVSFKVFWCIFVLAMSKLSLPPVICMISTIETALEKLRQWNSWKSLRWNVSKKHRVLRKYSMTLLASWGHGTVELSKWMRAETSIVDMSKPCFKMLDLFKAKNRFYHGIHHHEKPQLGDFLLICSKHFKQIQNDNTPLNRRLLLETAIVRFHVKLSGCRPWNHKKIKPSIDQLKFHEFLSCS